MNEKFPFATKKKKKQKLMGWKDKITQMPLQQPPWEAKRCYSGQEIP